MLELDLKSEKTMQHLQNGQYLMAKKLILVKLARA